MGVEAVLMLPIGFMFDILMAIIALLGAWWGFSDYGTAAWASWLIIGGWAYFRKRGIREQIKREEEGVGDTKSTAPDHWTERPTSKNSKIRDPKKSLKALGTSKEDALKKIIKKLPYSYILQGIPWIGDYVVLFTFPNVRFVLRELKK